MREVTRVCLLGFGEVGQTLLPPLLQAGINLVAFDQQFGDADSDPQRAAEQTSVLQTTGSAAEAVAQADLVISAVTAEQSLAAAAACVEGLQPGTWFMDLNSVSPGTKRETAETIESTDARYVEAAVMAPVAPKGIATPILLGGPHAETLLPIVRDLGFIGTEFFDAELGKAAASKMCRSVLIKGLESLLLESLLTARHYGVEETVLASLNNLMPGVDWKTHAAYMIGRSLEHGTRRGEEMCEAALTVQGAGLEPTMSRACADTQLWAAQFHSALQQPSLNSILDEILRLKT